MISRITVTKTITIPQSHQLTRTNTQLSKLKKNTKHSECTFIEFGGNKERLFKHTILAGKR